MKKKISEFATHKAAQAWCMQKTEKIDMIPELAEEFARIVEEVSSHPWLGNASTRELLEELTARIEVDGKLDYRTRDGTH